MEMLIVLLVLSLSEKNAEIKETLKSVLSFYRENRELLVTLAGTNNATANCNAATASAPTDDPPPAQAVSTSAPDGLRLIEEFLKRQKL